MHKQGEIDVLSIDVDGNDLYIWASIDPALRPKVVIIEYNAFVVPPGDLVQAPGAGGGGGAVHFGAGVGALAAVGAARGYSLVYAETRGVNLFFVRDDLVGRLRATARGGSSSDGGSSHRMERHSRDSGVGLDGRRTPAPAAPGHNLEASVLRVFS